MKKKNVKVRKERHYRPHVDYYHAAWVHLEHVKEKHPGHRYSLLSAFLMCAFTVEGYLNYVGPTVERGWDDFDKASPLAKLRHVACAVNLPLDASCRPFQTIIELFTFRNRLAHPRDSHVVEEYISTAKDYQRDFYTEPEPKWLKFGTENNARRCYEDVGLIIERINEKLPAPDPLPLSNLSWSGSASTEEN